MTMCVLPLPGANKCGYMNTHEEHPPYSPLSTPVIATSCARASSQEAANTPCHSSKGLIMSLSVYVGEYVCM